VFADAGYDRASMRAVAAAAGITTPVLYDHFASKADLYAALVADRIDDLIARWSEVGEEGGTAEDVFRRTVEAIFAWIEDNEVGWRMVFLDAPRDPAVAEVHRARQERVTVVLASQFERVAALRLSVPLDRERAALFLAETAKRTINAIATWWWANRDLTRTQIVDLAADLLWRGLGHVTKENR